MANYRQYKTESNDGDDGDMMTVATLTLDGWSMPDYWDQDDQVPPSWPTTAVAALIHMFTGTRLTEAGQKGVEISERLGWHIATLIADWADHTEPIYFPSDDLPDLLNTMELELPDGLQNTRRATKIVRRQLMSEQVQTTRFLVTHTREWYRQGLDILHEREHRQLHNQRMRQH